MGLDENIRKLQEFSVTVEPVGAGKPMNDNELRLKAVEMLGYTVIEITKDGRVDCGEDIFTDADLAEMLRVKICKAITPDVTAEMKRQTIDRKLPKIIIAYETELAKQAKSNGYCKDYWYGFLATSIQKMDAALQAIGKE